MNSTAPSALQMSFKRAFGIVIPICLISMLTAGAIISIANDIYAFAKPDTSYTLTVNESVDADSLAQILQDNGIINNAFAFSAYIKSKGYEQSISEMRGQWILNAQMSYREISRELF